MTTYIHAFRCKVCGNRFELTRHSEVTPKHPKCPRKACRGTSRVKQSHMADRGMDVAAGKVPAMIGSIPVKAMDLALEAGAANAGLTDLNTSIHYGESMAPKLPPRQQALADGFFGGGMVKSGRKRVQVDLSGALSGLNGGQSGHAQASPSLSVDPRSFMPRGQRGSSAVPQHTVIASDQPK